MTHGQTELMRYLTQLPNDRGTTVLPAKHRDSLGSLIRNGWVDQRQDGQFTIWTVTASGRAAYKLHLTERKKRIS